MTVVFSGGRTVEHWAFLDTDRHRRLVGLDPETGAVIITGVLVGFDRSEPPRWCITSSGLRVTLGRPGLPRDPDAVDQVMDAIDFLRSIVGNGFADDEVKLLPWRPLPHRSAVEHRFA